MANATQAQDERLLLESAGACALERDVIEVAGSDAASFLQGQLSQEIAAMPAGDSRWSLLLQPQGKLDALVRVARLDAERFTVDVDGGWGDATLARLNRFRLRVRADLVLVPWRCIAVRGPSSDPTTVAAGDDTVVAPAAWPGLAGFDVLGPDPSWPEGVAQVSPAALEAVRVHAGFPRMGAEIDERTIPAETGWVDRTVSFTKGCYTGQELVARIDSRGHVNRHLRRVTMAGGEVPLAGAAVVAGDRAVGAVTSATLLAHAGKAVALAYIRREVEVPAEALVEVGGSPAPAVIEALPG